jgi:hypothetical protein
MLNRVISRATSMLCIIKPEYQDPENHKGTVTECLLNAGLMPKLVLLLIVTIKLK